MARKDSGCRVLFQRALGRRHLDSLLLQPSVSTRRASHLLSAAPHKVSLNSSYLLGLSHCVPTHPLLLWEGFSCPLHPALGPCHSPPPS